jgi:signal transduction histidine kinase
MFLRFTLIIFLLNASIGYARNPSAFNPDTLQKIDLVFKEIQESDQEKCFELIRSLKIWNSTLQNDTLTAEILRWEGYTYVELGYKEKVEECLNKCIALSLKKGLKRTAYRAMLQLDYFYSLKDYEEIHSDSLLLKAIPLCISMKDTTRLIRAYDNLGYYYFTKKNLKKAYFNYMRSDSLVKSLAINKPYFSLLFNLGNYYRITKDFDEAEKYLSEGAKLIIGNKYYEELKNAPPVYLWFGMLYSDQKKYTEARESYLKGWELGKKHHQWNNLTLICQQLSDLEKKSNNFPEALQWQKLRFAYQDSLYKSDLTFSLHKQEVIWEINRQESKYNELSQNFNEVQNINRYALMVLLLTLGLIAALSYFNTQKKKYNEKLETEVQTQTHDLQIANKELERFNFAASHDMRTPIRNIISFIGLLERKKSLQSDEEIKDYLKYIRNYAYHLNELVQDMVAFTQIGKNKESENIELIDLNEVFKKATLLLQASIQEKNATVECQTELPKVMGNQVGFVHLFQNMIENGILYNRNDQPKVTISHCILHNQKVRIFVKDNGIGIDPTYQRKIFELFTRLHNMEEYPGTGLGLAICKKFVEQMGGSIGLEASNDHGTIFYIDFNPTSKLTKISQPKRQVLEYQD